MKIEVNLNRYLGKQITLPLLLLVLFLIWLDLAGTRKKAALNTEGEANQSSNINAGKDTNDDPTSNNKWKPVHNMRDNVISIKEEEGEEYTPWNETDPYPYKPFKPGEHRLTMGVSSIPVTHWIVLENTYKDRIEKKWEIIKSEYRDVIYHLDPVMITRTKQQEQETDATLESPLIITESDINHANNGLCETYKNLISYMTCRFPQYFQVILSPSEESAGVFYNSIMNEFHPVDPYHYINLTNDTPQCVKYKCYKTQVIPVELSTRLDVLKDEVGYFPLISCDKTRRAHELILSMSRIVEEDLLLLSTNSSRQFDNEYILHSGVFGFAAGFNPRNRFLKPLTLIHGPVPEYKRDLKKQMNKFFHTFKFDKLVKRVNYTFQNHDRLYVQSKFTDAKARSLAELHDGKDLHYRSERQTLIKFDSPDESTSGTVVFGIKTYLWNFRDEFLVNNFYCQKGVLDDLEQAIRDMNGVLGDYKGRSEWGPALLEILEKNKKKLKAH